jgi:hypothetical protein
MADARPMSGSEAAGRRAVDAASASAFFDMRQ